MPSPPATASDSRTASSFRNRPGVAFWPTLPNAWASRRPRAPPVAGGQCVRSRRGDLVYPHEVLGLEEPGKSWCTLVIPPISLNSCGGEWADCLIAEATFGEADAALAAEVGHMTAAQAAMVARDVLAELLYLNHLSQRYTPGGTPHSRRGTGYLPQHTPGERSGNDRSVVRISCRVSYRRCAGSVNIRPSALAYCLVRSTYTGTRRSVNR